MDSRQKKRLMWQVPFLLLLVIGTVLIIRQQRSMPYQHEEGFVFGTVYSVTYQYDRSLKTEIEAALAEVDGEFSMFNEKSTVARHNRGEQVQQSKMYKEVYDLAQVVTRETDGAFDITVAPLVNAWGFGFKKKGGEEGAGTPTPQQVDSLLKIPTNSTSLLLPRVTVPTSLPACFVALISVTSWSRLGVRSLLRVSVSGACPGR